MGRKKQQGTSAGRIVSRVLAALIIGTAGWFAGGIASGEWTGTMAMGGFVAGCFVGALFGIKALELFHAL